MGDHPKSLQTECVLSLSNYEQVGQGKNRHYLEIEGLTSLQHTQLTSLPQLKKIYLIE